MAYLVGRNHAILVLARRRQYAFCRCYLRRSGARLQGARIEFVRGFTRGYARPGRRAIRVRRAR
jgi:hypothetical protein